MGRYRPFRMSGGHVLQSGMNMQHPVGNDQPLRPMFGKYRGIVLRTFATDDAVRTEGNRRQGSQRVTNVECDVILVTSQTVLSRVPVMQRGHSANNAGPLWIPRESRVALGEDGRSDPTQPLNLNRVSRGGAPMPQVPPLLRDLDGDLVLVEFVEGDLEKPVISGALTHEHARRRVIAGDGWAEGSGAEKRGTPEVREHYLHHQGSEVRINGTGDVLIDTVGAHDDNDEEDASASGKGQVRIRVKESSDADVRFTVSIGDDEDVLEVWKDGGQLRIDLGEGADERLILGDTFKTFFDGEIAKINTFWSTLYNTHVHPVPMGGNTLVPTVTQTDTISQIPDDNLSDLAKTKKM